MSIKNNMKKTILLLGLIFLSKVSFTQNPDIKRTWHWYFGNGAGIDFSSGIATPVINGQLHTNEGCAVMSDTSGNLLFYTDGDSIWDSNHNLMPNGYGLFGCGNLGSSAQAAIIIPHPGNSNLFYIITNDCNENNCVNGLRYSIVDITLNGGFGDVTIKNSLLFAPGTETLAVTKHCNNRFYWIISHQYLNNNFVVYLVDSNGISNLPVINSIGSVYNYHGGFIVCSSDGSKIATAFISTLPINELFDFDNQTGVISNLIQLQSQFGGDWGPEFSFDNSKLYYTSNGNLIYQYDLSSGIDSVINNSRLTISSVSDNSTYGTLAKAPDGKIYISSVFFDSISTINNPNVYGIGCSLQTRNFYLINQSGIGLPNFISNYLSPNNTITCSTGISENENIGFDIYPNPVIDKLFVKMQGILKIELCDVTGRVLLSKNNIVSNKEKQYEIDISAFSEGIYLLMIQTKTQLITKKIIHN